MDPLALLDFEKRNGYSTKDIDQFVTKVDKVAEVMEKIKSGEFKDEDFDTVRENILRNVFDFVKFR